MGNKQVSRAFGLREASVVAQKRSQCLIVDLLSKTAKSRRSLLHAIMQELKMVYGTTERIESLLDSKIGQKFENLSQNGKVAAEYVWIGGTGSDLRSKTKTLDSKPKKVEDLPVWNFDGSSTGQAPGNDSEVFLVPRYVWIGCC